MGRKVFKAEQIIGKLREAEVMLAKGATVGEVCRQIGVTDQTYYRWRKEYGGLRMDQAKRLKELEKENSRLKKVRFAPNVLFPDGRQQHRVHIQNHLYSSCLQKHFVLQNILDIHTILQRVAQES